MLLRTITRVALALGVALAFVAVGAPAHAAVDQADLRVTSSVDKDTLRLGDRLTVTVTVRNAGPVAAKQVFVQSEHENCIDWTSPALSDSDRYDLAAGDSRVFTRTGRVIECGRDWGRAEAFYFIRSTNEPANGYNFTTARARVLGAVGTVSVAAVGVPVAGHTEAGVAGVTVGVYDEFDGRDIKVREVKTGAEGRVKVSDLTPGDYHVIYTAPEGWKLSSAGRADFRVRTDEPVRRQIRLIVNGSATPPTDHPTGTPTTTATAAAPPASDGGADSAGSGTGSAAGTGGGSGGTDGGPDGDDRLAHTGVDVTVIGVAGVVLLFAGGLAFAMARRRRSRFVAGD